MDGDVAAARLVLSYTVGRPEATVNPDDLDLQEYQQFDRESKAAVAAVKFVTSPQIGVMNEIIRASRPLMNDTVVNGLARLAEEGRTEQAEEETNVRELQQERAAQTQGAPDDTEDPAEPSQQEAAWEPPDPEGPLQSPPQGRAKGHTRIASRAARDARQSEAGGSRAPMPNVPPAAPEGEEAAKSSPIDNGDNGGAAAGRAPRGSSGQEAGGPDTPRPGRPRGVPTREDDREDPPQGHGSQRPRPC
jgi:hypothetical protein